MRLLYLIISVEIDMLVAKYLLLLRNLLYGIEKTVMYFLKELLHKFN